MNVHGTDQGVNNGCHCAACDQRAHELDILADLTGARNDHQLTLDLEAA